MLHPQHLGHPAPRGLDVLSRGPRRLSVAQVERALDEIGNLPPGTVRLEPGLAAALGRPDFGRVTEESLEPSPLFMKFMMDLGAIACRNLTDYEPARPLSERVFTRHPETADNLRHLLVRFTGIEGAAAEPYLERLQRVFQAGRSGPRGELGGYEAVCLALFTSPEFLLY